MFDISPIQILIVLVIALLVFGPKRLPEMGKSIGRGIREFKTAIVDDEPRPAPAPPTPAAPAATAASTDSSTATVSAVAKDDDDDVLEGVVVRGDQPPRSSDS
jgi:sec-independent protein translocase protein TatA